MDLAIHPGFPHPTGDQLGGLGAEIQDEHFVTVDIHDPLINERPWVPNKEKPERAEPLPDRYLPLT